MYNIIYPKNGLEVDPLSNLIADIKGHIELNEYPTQYDLPIYTQSLDIRVFPFELDIIVAPLNQVATELGKEWVITALIRNPNFRQGLYIIPKAMEVNADLRLKKGTVIGVYHALDGLQLQKLNQNIEYVIVANQAEMIDQLTNHAIGAVLVNNTIDDCFSKINNEELTFVNLNPKEMIPVAGSKAIALLCRKDNIKLRKSLQQLHDKSISKLTNLERNVMKMQQPDATCS